MEQLINEKEQEQVKRGRVLRLNEYILNEEEGKIYIKARNANVMAVIDYCSGLFEKVKEHTWTFDKHLGYMVCGNKYYLHTFVIDYFSKSILQEKSKGMVIDHFANSNSFAFDPEIGQYDLNKLNNCLSNIHCVTEKQNRKNRNQFYCLPYTYISKMLGNYFGAYYSDSEHEMYLFYDNFDDYLCHRNHFFNYGFISLMDMLKSSIMNYSDETVRDKQLSYIETILNNGEIKKEQNMQPISNPLLVLEKQRVVITQEGEIISKIPNAKPLKKGEVKHWMGVTQNTEVEKYLLQRLKEINEQKGLLISLNNKYN